MARIRKSAAALFDSITLEGNLITPAMLAHIAAREAGNQTETDYGVLKGLTLRDEIARYFRIGQALFTELFASPTPSTSATITFVESLMRDVFGFSDVRRIGTRLHGERVFAVTLEGQGGRVPMVAVPPADDLDHATVNLAGDGRRRSAASSVQDWLNANDDARWGFCCNGERLRLVRTTLALRGLRMLKRICVNCSTARTLRTLPRSGYSSMPLDSARPTRPLPTALWNVGAKLEVNKERRRGSAFAMASRLHSLRSATDFSRIRTTVPCASALSKANWRFWSFSANSSAWFIA